MSTGWRHLRRPTRSREILRNWTLRIAVHVVTKEFYSIYLANFAKHRDRMLKCSHRLEILQAPRQDFNFQKDWKIDWGVNIIASRVHRDMFFADSIYLHWTGFLCHAWACLYDGKCKLATISIQGIIMHAGKWLLDFLEGLIFVNNNAPRTCNSVHVHEMKPRGMGYGG